jgi:thymidylate synthase
MDRVKDIRRKLKEKYDKNEFVILNNGTKTVELISNTFLADENYIFKEPNQKYINNEIDWYLSQSLNVYDICGKIPKIWKNVADKDGNINSNYGWCIFSEENGRQYRNCFRQLLNDPTTRRACMIYNRPSMQYDWNANGKQDFMCTYSTQQFIRNNKLIYCVLMRSNDAVFGYRNDYAWHKFIAHKLLVDLSENGIKLEDEPELIWTAASLHVYEQHFLELEQYKG